MKNVQFIGLCLGGDFNDFQQFSIEHAARNVVKLAIEADRNFQISIVASLLIQSREEISFTSFNRGQLKNPDIFAPSTY